MIEIQVPFLSHSGIKIEVSNRRKIEKCTNIQKLINTFLKNQCVEEEIKREIRKYLKTNENENTGYQNFGKEVLKGKFIAINIYIKELEKTY